MNRRDVSEVAVPAIRRGHGAGIASRRGRSTGALLFALVLVLLAVARQVANADGLTNSLTVGTALGFAVPIALAGLGGLLSERAGIVNIGLEGMMILGTWFAGWFGWHFGPWGALVGGIVGGLCGGALHALATITFAIDQTVSGVAINIFAPAAARFLGKLIFEGHGDGTISNSPSMASMGRFSMPFFGSGTVFGWQAGNPFGWLEDKNWFLVSDLAGLVKGLTGDLSYSTVLMLLCVPGVWYLVWRTRWGLRVRSSGEKPTAGESLGLDITRIRWQAVLLSGTLAGLGGAWLAINVGRYQEGMTTGRGYLGLAALIFGNWLPIGVLVGSFLFAFPTALQVALGDEPARGFVLSVAMAFALLAAWSFTRRLHRQGLIVTLFAIGVALFYVKNPRIDEQLVQAFPFIITLIVLIFSSKRLRPPKAAGSIWRKGQAT